MIIRSILVSLVALALLAPFSARAISFSFYVSPFNIGVPHTMSDGDRLVVAGRMENFDEEEVYEFSLNLTGYDSNQNGLADDGLAFHIGSASTDMFVDSFEELPSGQYELFGGIPNDLAAPEERGSPQTGGQPVEELSLALFEGSSQTPSDGNGLSDPGWGGIFIQDGNDHFNVVFTASNPTGADRLITLNLELRAIGAGGVELPVSTNSVDILILGVPEPGTGILLGLGLLGLTGRRVRGCV